MPTYESRYTQVNKRLQSGFVRTPESLPDCGAANCCRNMRRGSDRRIVSCCVVPSLDEAQIWVLRKLPYCLCAGWKECGRVTEEPFVPVQCRIIIGDCVARKLVEKYDLSHARCRFQAL